MKLSKTDQKLKEYLELKQEIKEREKRLEVLKKELKELGSYSSNNYVLIIETQERLQPPSVKELLAEFGRKGEKLLKSISYQTLAVSKKGDQ